MKLLLDENLSRRIVPFLQADYAGSTQVALIGMEQADDYEIWAYARVHDFVIVTKDADFYDLSLLHGAPPKVIWLKGGMQQGRSDPPAGGTQRPDRVATQTGADDVSGDLR